MPSHQEHVAAWEAIRTKGKWNFVLKRGVLGYGAIFFIIQVAIPWLMGDSSEFTEENLTFKAAASLIFGLVLGLIYWTKWNRKYGNRLPPN